MDKKQTRGQLERRIKNAIVFVPKDKDTQTIFFYDKGLRLTVTTDVAVIETGYHRHVFMNFTGSGLSRPYLYTKRLIEIAKDNNCNTEDGYSFAKLSSILKAKEDKSEYNIITYIGWWLFNIFQPLYGIGETEVESFLVYEDYIHNIARNTILLSEKTKDITNKEFIGEVIDNLKEYTVDIVEQVLFKRKTDDEIIKENIDAIQEQETEEQISDGSKDSETE